MNIKEIHSSEKVVSTVSIFKSEGANATALRILKSERLKEHITQTQALLICIEGHVIYQDEKGGMETLEAGDYINIDPMVKHWVDAVRDSYLILVK